ncbi:Uncharacterised protein [Mycoplasmopsis maculosa]|uniref:Core-binding (CB) domain-containing protein n=1 Tax=Mycoplasmopsis maculosa TaxID=114885 RepID=A0A449B3U7_9BACT|nr:hypothetical protein [Mycoplasmopsis maculosa]VEU75256.1 Uncharacterised protein [Mycoplasmopsis maculosa]
MNKFNLSELKEKYFDYLKNRDLKKQTLKMYKIILKEIDGYYTKDEFFLHANKIINNSNLRNNTKALRCRIFLAFTNKIKEFTNEFWDDSKIKRKKAEQTRIAYTDSEINLLLDELKYFNNIKFEYIFNFYYWQELE